MTLALSSVTAVLVVLFQEETGAVFFWGHGSLAVADTGRSLAALPLLGAGLAGGLLLARTLDVLGTGDDTARGLGVPVGRVRLAAVLLSVLLTACAVAVTGPIGFVGLAAPHLVRFAGVRRHAVLLPAAACGGGAAAGGGPAGAGHVADRQRGRGRGGDRVVRCSAVPVAGPAAAAGTGRPGTVMPARGGRRPPYPPLLAGGAAVVAALLAGGLLLGDVAVPPGELPGLLAGGGDELLRGVVLEYRLPRLLVAALAGRCWRWRAASCRPWRATRSRT